MHGKGVYSWKDGRKFEGEYQFDKKHGYGCYRWSDGRKYIGEWKNGMRDGQGKMISRDGSEREGIWEKDKRVKWLEDKYSLAEINGSVSQIEQDPSRFQ